MRSDNSCFLLNDAGRRLPADPFSLAQELGLAANSDVIDHAIRQFGFVRIQLAPHALFVELYPSKVAPLAALEAFHQVKVTSEECVLLACLGDSREHSRFEFFSSPKAARVTMGKLARAASRRAAAELQAGTTVSSGSDGVCLDLSP
jgi:hypothetical protein